MYAFKPFFTKLITFLLGMVNFLMPTKSLTAQHLQIDFDYIGTEEGLPQSQVLDIIQDRVGFIWLGTMGGLVRYDGKEFKLFTHEPEDTNSLSYPIVKNLFEDSKGYIWAGTPHGLNRFDQNTHKVKRYLYKTNGYKDNERADIKSVSEDQKGRIWVGTVKNLLYHHNNTFNIYNFSDTTGPAPNDKKIKGGILQKDLEGNLLLSSTNYIYKIQPNNDSIYPLKIYKQLNHFKEKREIYNQYFYQKGKIWYNGPKGINLWIPDEECHMHYGFPRNIDPHSITDIIEDNYGNIWIGTSGNGLLYLDTKRGKFSQFKYDPKNPRGLRNNIIESLYLDDNGNLWIGTFNGLQKISTLPQRFSTYQLEKGIGNPVNQMYRVYPDKRRGVWMSTYENRLFHAPFNKPIEEVSFPKSISQGARIQYFYTHPNGKLWMSYKIKGGVELGGLLNYDFLSENLVLQNLGDTIDEQGVIYYIESDRHDLDYLWLGHTYGLCKVHIPTGKLKWFFPHRDLNEKKPNRVLIGIQQKDKIWLHLEDYFNGRLGFFDTQKQQFFLVSNAKNLLIRQMVETPDGRIWVATGQGLGCLNPVDTSFHLLTINDGLIENELMGITVDKEGILWLKSMRYVTKYDRTKQQFEHFKVSKSMREFNAVGADIGVDGKIYFNGNNGFYAFDPFYVRKNQTLPRIVLTEISLFNESMILDTVPEFKRYLHLNYKNSKLISLKFSALHYADPDHNQYSWLMEGFDKTWSPPSYEHVATYTNLNYGTYTFRAKASNADGIWDEEGFKIRIKIHPPWWQRWWAFLFYGIFIFGSLMGIYYFQLQRKLDRAETRKLKELGDFKTRMYTNITHEFRTPLTLIIGPIERALRKTINLPKEELQMIHKNALNLLNLINQMLTLNKLDAGLLKPTYQYGDIIAYIKYLFKSFHSKAEEKSIRFSFHPETPQLVMAYNKDFLQSILTNLLSNALKFTPKEGEVKVKALIENKAELPNDSYLKLTVIDSGIGISGDALPYIFDRFYQVNTDSSSLNSGTGIGLSLTKELAELSGGKITVESEIGKGTSFSVWLPIITHDPLNDLENILNENELLPKSHKLSQNQNFFKSQSKINKILIIEDHLEMAQYIASCLVPTYGISFAIDGQEGLEKALKEIPDLIICDVMMPKKNGVDVCHILKQDERSSHIPIILLTAKGDPDSRLQGLNQGADAYLVKPFREDELQIRIKKLLEGRRKLQDYYLSNFIFLSTHQLPSQKENKSKELAFLQRAKELVEKHFNNSTYGVAHFCREIGMSQPQLYRKLQALTGLSPNHFIRSIRLQKARQLLQDSQLSISQIAYETGFADPSYFARSFSKTYGFSPSEYRKSWNLNIDE